MPKKRSPSSIDISVIIPVRNEEKNLNPLSNRLVSTLNKMAVEYEIIFVTDENSDNTLHELNKLHRKNTKIKVLKLSKSFGQHIAVLAGIDFSKGENLVLMDGDLQDFPEDIELLYERLIEGYDVVYANKKNKNDTAFKNYTSSIFLNIMKLFSNSNVSYNFALFRIMTRRMAMELRKFQEIDPNIAGIMGLIGLPSSIVTVRSGKRVEGKTKYNLWKQINLAISFFTSFSTKILRVISFFGFIVSFMSFFYMAYLILSFIIMDSDSLRGWRSIVTLISFFGGIQILSLGIVGEYIAKIFIEAKKRPLYVIQEAIGF